MPRLGALLALLAALAWAPAALAHAALVASEPADGAVVATAPSRLVLTFDEPVAPITLGLADTGGGSAALTAWQRRGNAIVITPPGAIGRGTHALSWRVISLDGHPVGGAVVFSVGAPSAGPPPATAARTPGAVDSLIWAARVVLYLALFVGVGGAVFRAWIADGRIPPAATAIVRGVLAAGLVAVVLSVGLQGLDAFAAPLAALAAPAVWREGAANTYGITAAIAFLALAVGLLALAAGRHARVLAAVALAGVGLALAASGHASAAPPQALTRPAVFLHAVAVAWWIGALIPLALSIHAGDPGYPAALARFSRRVPYAVAIILAAGITLAIVQIETPSAVLATAYGRLFAAKLVLVLVLLALAAWNRWRLTPALAAAAPSARRAMVRAIAVETLLVLLIFAVVAGWRFTPPPRALAAAGAAPVSLHIHGAAAMAELTLAPGRAGPVTAAIELMAMDGRPLAAKGVTLVLSDPAAGIGPIRRAAAPAGAGKWRVAGLLVPAAGTWRVDVEVLVDDFAKVSLADQVTLR